MIILSYYHAFPRSSLRLTLQGPLNMLWSGDGRYHPTFNPSQDQWEDPVPRFRQSGILWQSNQHLILSPSTKPWSYWILLTFNTTDLTYFCLSRSPLLSFYPAFRHPIRLAPCPCRAIPTLGRPRYSTWANRKMAWTAALISEIGRRIGLFLDVRELKHWALNVSGFFIYFILFKNYLIGRK